MRHFRAVPLLAVIALGPLTSACAAHSAERARASAPVAPTPAVPWAAELAQFATEDASNPPKPGGVLFVGSSSIRLWPSLAADFPGLPVINRGFGGSELGDVVRLADRVVLPYRPRTIVLYAGDNDLAAGKTPADVTAAFRQFVAIVHRTLPTTQVLALAIKPSLAREALLPQMRETNAAMADIARGDSLVHYIDVFTPMLDSTGRPRKELFQADGLHMTPAGYAIWRALLAPALR